MLTYGNQQDLNKKTPLQIRGLSTDTKPTNCGNGSIYIEIDTASIYFYDAENQTWIKFA